MKQYNVTGMSCAACSARVEKAVSNVPGVTACSVSLLTNSMGVEGTAADQAVIDAVAHYGVAAGRIAGASGVWIDAAGTRPRKICAVGVRSSRYVTMHGFALNVSTDLRYFDHINPCGFTDRGVTSIAAETGSQPSMQEVKQLVIRELATALQCEITSGS